MGGGGGGGGGGGDHQSSSCGVKYNFKKGLWTMEEDKILVDYIRVHGKGKWSRISKVTGLKRCGKSCRLRWMNYLSPGVKRDDFSPEEEDLIIRLHKLLGNRWSLIAGRVPGRTDNQVKNHWNTHLSKKLGIKKAKNKNVVTSFAPSNKECREGGHELLKHPSNSSSSELPICSGIIGQTTKNNNGSTRSGVEASNALEPEISTECLNSWSFWFSNADITSEINTPSSMDDLFLDGYALDVLWHGL